VVARVRLDSLGTSSVRTVEELTVPNGKVAAEAKAVLVACDEQRRPRPLTDDERTVLERA
jgi:acyl-CoA thioesterase FadM